MTFLPTVSCFLMIYWKWKINERAAAFLNFRTKKEQKKF